MSRGLDTHRRLEHDKGYGSDEKGRAGSRLGDGWLGAERTGGRLGGIDEPPRTLLTA